MNLLREIEAVARKAATSKIRDHLGTDITRPLLGLLRTHPSFGSITISELVGSPVVVSKGTPEKGRKSKNNPQDKNEVLSNEKRTRLDAKILMLVGNMKAKGIQAPEIRRVTSLGEHKVREALKRLQKLGKVKCLGNTTNMKFYITKSAPSKSEFIDQQKDISAKAKEKKRSDARSKTKITSKATAAA